MKKPEIQERYSRRQIFRMALTGAVAMSSVWGATRIFSILPSSAAVISDQERIIKVTKPDEQWKKELSSQQYNVLREQGTERPFTSPLLEEHRKGLFVCAGCDFPLFTSGSKYDSGTGWPSFYQAIAGHVGTSDDFKLILPRTEYHCARCGGHQGHVFKDGPQPTGLRYCNNGLAIKFVEQDVE